MGKEIHFYFDVGSPTAYLAWTQLPAIAARHDAIVDPRPMLLGGVFKETGNTSPIVLDVKRKYMSQDIERYVRRYRVPFIFSPHFPVNTVSLMRGAIAAKMDKQMNAYLDVVFPAIWQHELNVADPQVIAKALDDGGLDPQKFRERIQQDDIKQALFAATSAAVNRGVFGAPTMFVGDEMFFGQDRLDFVEEALSVA